jgi:hypothetical protein
MFGYHIVLDNCIFTLKITMLVTNFTHLGMVPILAYINVAASLAKYQYFDLKLSEGPCLNICE